MTYDQFKAGVDRLVRIYDPYRWSDDRESEYYRILQSWTPEAWTSVVEIALSTADVKKMPTPARLIELGGAGDSIRKVHGKRKVLANFEKSCDKCIGGAVWFEFQHPVNGNTYDRMCACDCPVGDGVARHMVQTARRQGITLSDGQTRAKWVLREQREREQAENGSSEHPTEHEQDAVPTGRQAVPF